VHPLLGFPPFGAPFPGFDMGFNTMGRYAQQQQQQQHHHHHHHQQQQQHQQAAAAAAAAAYNVFPHAGLFDTGNPQPGFVDFHRPPSPISSGLPQSGVEAAIPGYSVGDLYDAKGHPASSTLFVDCLPYDIHEYTVHGIFCTTPGFKVSYCEVVPHLSPSHLPL
jgi:hypothetical protein